MCVLLPSGETRNYISAQKERSRLRDRSLGIGGIMVKPEGFVMMNAQIPCVKGYNEDQIAIIMDDLGLKDFPVILGMPTIFQVMEVIKESEISKLAIPWASLSVFWLMRGMHARMSQLAVDDVANKSVAPGFSRFLWMRNLSSILPSHWAVWVCMSVNVCLSGCVTPCLLSRLMQNCLGELNLTYCLIYLDDVIEINVGCWSSLIEQRSFLRDA